MTTEQSYRDFLGELLELLEDAKEYDDFRRKLRVLLEAKLYYLNLGSDE